MAKTNTIKFDLATSTATTIIKEENAMTKRMEEINKALVNNQKVQDAGYIKKNDLMDILNNEFNMGFSKKNTRAEMVDAFMAMYKDAIRVADEVAYGNILVGDLDITHDNAPVEEPVPVPVEPVVVKEDPKAKTDKLFALIKACGADNNKKGFGYTISSFMLQACILNAGAGITKLKGHTVTPEEDKMTQDVYSWLKKNNYIKPVVYSVQEDEKVRVYMPEYPGKTNATHVKMIPYNKSAGYTAKKITSFLITIR